MTIPVSGWLPKPIFRTIPIIDGRSPNAPTSPIHEFM